MELHQIQKQILIKLSNYELNEARFSQLKPKDIENDLYNYHLQHLVKNKLLKKSETTYSLTNKGINEILKLDSLGNQYLTHRVSILLYIIDESNDPPKMLAQKRIRKPYFGEINPGISGKVLIGELVTESAERKLLEETGLSGKCRYVGTIRKIRKLNKGNNIDDGFFHVCVCKSFKGKLIEKNEFGENFWCDFKQARKYQKSCKSGGAKSLEVLQKILKNNFSNFFLEEIIQMESF